MSQQQMLEDHQQQNLQFSDEEIQNLKEIFELFDKNHTGQINMKDLEAIMQSLQRNPEEAKELLRAIRMEQMEQEGQQVEMEDEVITFDDFIKLM